MTAGLFDLYVTHCFFWSHCSHVVRDIDPDSGHARMEVHYEADHVTDIARVVGYVR